MKNKPLNSLLKHIDFIILDIVSLQICFLVAFWIRFGFSNPFLNSNYLFEDFALVICQLLSILFSNSYKNILRRKRFDEFISVFYQTVITFALTIVLLFMTRRTSFVARLHLGYTAVIFLIVCSCIRQLNKRRVNNYFRKHPNEGRSSMVLVAPGHKIDEVMKNLCTNKRYHDFFISGIIVLDGDLVSVKNSYDAWLICMNDDALKKISHEWVDEVFVYQTDKAAIPKDFMLAIISMGITLNCTMDVVADDDFPLFDFRKIDKYKSFTTNLKLVSPGEQMLKRLMDIAGGIVGCLIAFVLFLFVAPAIYIASPGPVFFAQERIGKNGKVFKMYKFRSMYLDAEERKKDFQAQNDYKDGLMFKVDDDPRIIGSEKKDKNGKPKGIGNFIRKTSIDEFPQFWNVLKGDMSLVGTRPPSLDEWSKYNLRHRVRMSTKPGITGMWQVSGRSEITDFDEVVRLDREYIENWSIMLDIKILFKTVIVVFKRKGAK